MKRQQRPLIIMGVFWTGLMLLFDGILGYSIFKQAQSLGFAHTTGYISKSAITEDRGSDGETTHGVDIHYHYEVRGETFDGDRYRYVAGSSSDSAWAFNAVARYPVGAEVTVYYNPRRPQDSVLSPGLDGSNLMMVLFLTPFNATMFGFWNAGIGLLARKLKKSSNGGVWVRTEGQVTRVRLPRVALFLMPLIVVGLVAFVEMFPIAFTYGFHPPLKITTAALLAAYGAGGIMFFWNWWKIRSGAADLIIDRLGQTIQLPRTFGRKTRIQIPFADLTELKAETITDSGSDGRRSYTYAAILCWRGSNSASGKLLESPDESRVTEFTEWLRQELNLHDSLQRSSAWKSTMEIPGHSNEIR